MNNNTTRLFVNFLDNNTNMVLVENTDTHYLYSFEGKVENENDFYRKTLLLKVSLSISKLNDDNVKITMFESTGSDKTYYILNKLRDASYDNIPYYRTLRKVLKKEYVEATKPKPQVSYSTSSSQDNLDNFQPTRWEDERDEDTGRVIGGGFKPY